MNQTEPRKKKIRRPGTLSRGRALWIYGLLIVGSVIFMWPFLWMISTSGKSAREMMTSTMSLLPEFPLPKVQSPYVDSRYFKESPPREMLGVIEKKVADLHYPWPAYATPETAIGQVSLGIYQGFSNTLSAETWKLPPADLNREIAARIDANLVRQIFDQLDRRLSLGQLRVRSKDLVEEALVREDNAATAWRIEGSGTANLEAAAEDQRPFAILHYDFRQGDTVALTQTFTTGFDLNRLSEIQLYLRNDESWNGLKIYVEKLGVLYESVHSTALGNFEHWNVLTWQEPGPDDKTNKIKTWTLLREVDRGPRYVSDPHQMKITLKITQAGLLQACREKLSQNYVVALTYIPFWRYVATSIFVVILNIIGTLFSCSLVAYSFARLNWPGRDFCFILMLATMMIPPQVTMIPQFLIMRELGWYNTLLPLWTPSFLGTAFYVFLLRQFFKGIPKELEEAARMDGCGFFRIYWHIMLPLVKPTLAAIAILTFMGTWNDFMGPLIYLSDQRLYTLSFGLYAFNVQAGTDPALSMGITIACSVLMTLPVIAVFFFAQKYFIQGVTMSGIK